MFPILLLVAGLILIFATKLTAVGIILAVAGGLFVVIPLVFVLLALVGVAAGVRSGSRF